MPQKKNIALASLAAAIMALSTIWTACKKEDPEPFSTSSSPGTLKSMGDFFLRNQGPVPLLISIYDPSCNSMMTQGSSFFLNPGEVITYASCVTSLSPFFYLEDGNGHQAIVLLNTDYRIVPQYLNYPTPGQFLDVMQVRFLDNTATGGTQFDPCLDADGTMHPPVWDINTGMDDCIWSASPAASGTDYVSSFCAGMAPC